MRSPRFAKAGLWASFRSASFLSVAVLFSSSCQTMTPSSQAALAGGAVFVGGGLLTAGVATAETYDPRLRDEDDRLVPVRDQAPQRYTEAAIVIGATTLVLVTALATIAVVLWVGEDDGARADDDAPQQPAKGANVSDGDDDDDDDDDEALVGDAPPPPAP